MSSIRFKSPESPDALTAGRFSGRLDTTGSTIAWSRFKGRLAAAIEPRWSEKRKRHHASGCATTLAGSRISAALRIETPRRIRATRHVRGLTVAGVVLDGPRAFVAVRLLAEALTARGERVTIVDPTGRVSSHGRNDIAIGPDLGTNLADRVSQLRQRIDNLRIDGRRVLIVVPADAESRELAAYLGRSQGVLWIAESRFAARTHQDISRFRASNAEVGSRTRIVWLLGEHARFSPLESSAAGEGPPAFKLELAEIPALGDRRQQHGIGRIVRHLRGVRLGLALGGGGARGLAHLGVLSVLERAGISFDLMAGTSSGALMGLPYAAGWDPQQALRGFHEALTPPRLLRWSGVTRRAFLAGMFRSGGWNRLLRPYFGEARLEQLQLPLSTVAADLIGGRTVIRRQGDAIHAVLESINVPVLSRPILRDGMALVDGGIVNNVPADVLAAQGATLVVAIDVSPRLRQPYRTVGWGTIGSLLAQGNPLRTLSRVREIQAYDGTALRAQAAGLIISPDTSGFDFADFHRAHELAAVGAAAGEELLPTLRDMLAAHER